MAKDKKLALTPEEYWEWRTTIAEMQASEEKVKALGFEAQCMFRGAEIMNLKAQLYQASVVRDAKSVLNDNKNEYVKFKTLLETRLGIDLTGKIISDINFEVLEDPEGSKKNDLKNIGEKK